DAAAAMAKVAQAFAKLADASAAPLQAYVNEVCNLDPKAQIASEYDKMSPAQITASLSGKTLDDILDDPVTNSTRPGMLAFQKKVLSTYFTTVSHERKAGVLSSALRNAPEAAEAGSVAGRTKMLSAIFLGAGPLMQKTLQGIDRRAMGPHGGAIDVLKSSIPPLPDSYVVAKLDEIAKLNPDKYAMRLNVEGKPFVTLGAATVGQAVRCTFMNNQGGTVDVIVKILRPGVKERFDEDVKIFDAVAKTIPSVDKVWAARVKTIADEFDFRVEAKNIQDGQVYEVRDNRYVMVKDKKTGKMVPKVDAKTGKRVHVPGSENTWTVSAMKVPEGVKQSSDVLVGSVAPGEPFDKVLAKQTAEIHALFAGVFETDPDGRILRKDGKPVVRKDMSAAGFLAIHNKIEKAVGDIAESGAYFKHVVWKWVEEALFKSGTMHNDVHTGNIMLDTEGQRATFIDFGNLVKLDDKERTLLLKMVATVAAKHTELFVEAFGELLGKGTLEHKAFLAKKDKVEAAVRQVIHKGLAEADTGYRFQAVLSELQKLGVDIPPKVAAFVEGLTRLQNCHEEISELLEETEALYRAYEEQILRGSPALAPRDPDDEIGKLLDLLAKPDGLSTLGDLGNRSTPFAMEIYNARVKAMNLIWNGNKGVVKGSLVPKLREAMKEEETLPGNEKLSHLVSLVSHHVDGDNAAKIDDALADYASKKRSLRAAVLSGAANQDELRQKLAEAASRLEHALADGLIAIDLALNEVIDAKAPRASDFKTETAAEIFADIVGENIASVKKSFSGLIGKGRIANAFRNAMKDDANHQHDGHKKVRGNKL
ncbi:MAG: phosphotransferase, partial [Kiritimatiellae bacterium]|nr:phosphotransferase [Kiritimatiellia bacterium]